MTDSTAEVHDPTPAPQRSGVCCQFVVRAPGVCARRPGSATLARSHYSALSSVSPVRMRITRSMSVMKILPSPTLPVLADFMMASIT